MEQSCKMPESPFNNLRILNHRRLGGLPDELTQLPPLFGNSGLLKQVVTHKSPEFLEMFPEAYYLTTAARGKNAFVDGDM